MSSRALIFGSAASDYERFRPAYPAAVVDEVLAYAGRAVASALEIGAGTGKATRVFAARDIAVTATEPDAAMLAVLGRHVPDSVRTVRATFEDVPMTTRYDLVYAAASLHWTRPEGRWERVASLLVPGGVFASFGGPVRLADPALEEALCSAREPYLADDEVPPPDGTPADSLMQWPGSELEASEWFDDVRQVLVERRSTVPAADFVGLLSTVSAYLGLDPAVRGIVMQRIHDVLPEQVDVVGDITLHLARLASDA
ncbi:class I SAM-dependent methyltransferase [Nocardioides sp. P5_E3]